MAKAILTISSKNYSSWSLRGWFMTRMSGLPFEEEVVPIMALPDMIAWVAARAEPDALQELDVEF